MTPAGTRVPRAAGSRASLVLAVLLVADLLLIAASLEAQRRGWSDGRYRQWLLRAEGGWPEQFCYAKEATCAVLLLLLWRRTGGAVFAAWAAVFACALADDRLQVHERAGRLLARLLPLPELAGLREQDLGELAVWGLAGVVPLVVVAVLHRRSPGHLRAASRGMAVVVGGYAFFGVVVDQFHALTMGGPLDRGLGVLEDGGELVLLSVAVWYVLALLVAARPTGPAPRDQDPARASAEASSSPA